MASRVVGIDLGAYSVKVAVAVPGFRSATISEMVERQVPPGDETHLVRSTRVLGSIIREYGLGEDTHYVAIPGDQVFIHILEFPFKSLRRADLTRAVGAELENVLPIDLEEMVYAFEPIPRTVAVEVTEEGGDPSFVPGQERGMVAPPAEGMRVLACAMHRDRAREFLDGLEENQVSSRGLVAGPESYSKVMAKVPSLAGPGAFAVIDVGHERTDVCVVAGGRTVFARTISRGGRHQTAAIARAFQPDDPEHAKHQDGFIGSSNMPPPTEAWQNIHNALMPEVGPLARDLRQTFMACRAKVGVAISRAVLIGGGSRLRGLPEFLAERLGVSVRLLSAEDHEAILGGRQAAGADVACLAVGVALEGATGRPVFDLRQGDLAYKADLSIFREKAVALIASALIVVAFATVAGFAKMRSLKQTEQVLAKRMAVETVEVFEKQMDAEEVLAMSEDGEFAGDSPVPKHTAYDILLATNAAMPKREAVNVDVREIGIKDGKVTIELITRPNEKLQASEAITEIEKALKTVDCFESVARGDTTTEGEDAKRVTVTVALKEKCK